jgi:hypothetical protein
LTGVSATDQPPGAAGKRDGRDRWGLRVPPSPLRAAVALASSTLLILGTFLPWQVVRYEQNREVFGGWRLAAGEAGVCLALAAVGVVAGWSFTRARGIVAALLGRLALLASGGVAAAVAGLQALRVAEKLELPGLSSQPGMGLVIVGVGGLGLLGAGAWAAWRPAL